MLSNFSVISDQYKTFAENKSKCKQCSIFQSYKQVVQSEGNAKNPTFVFIGECPGRDETEQNRPFIGRAGQRLRKELKKHKSFNKTTTLITNVLSCRPLNNRFPCDSDGPYEIYHKNGAKKIVKARQVVNFCATNWLRKELDIVKPKIIITLGSQALDYVRGDRGVTAMRGMWKFLPRYRAWSMAVFHPSYVLRCQNDPNKSYISEQFDEDIENVASNWYTIVQDDPRMRMTEEAWKREYALQYSIDKGIFNKPLNQSGQDD